MSSTRLIIKDRGKGKSTHLVYTSAATGYPIIVHTSARKEYLYNMADNLGVYMPEPITLNEWEKFYRGKEIENILLDDAEDVISEALNRYFGTNVITATITDKLKEEYENRTRR